MRTAAVFGDHTIQPVSNCCLQPPPVSLHTASARGQPSVPALYP